MKNDTLKGQYRINEQIRAKEVQVKAFVGKAVSPAQVPLGIDTA